MSPDFSLGPAVDEADAATERMLRIKLPLRYHIELHRLKLTSGKTMAQIVQEALDRFLLDVETAPNQLLVDSEAAPS